jgi:hypothetical protein
MSKTIYQERGIDVLDDGRILLIICPKCKRENYALNVNSGICTWCGYNTHEDAELKERAINHKEDNE